MGTSALEEIQKFHQGMETYEHNCICDGKCFESKVYKTI